MIINKILQKITNTPNLGLLPHKKDDRDLKFGFLFGFKYKPKHERNVIETLSTKNQNYNTCGWNSSTTAHEMDEGVKLDPRTLVLFAKREGKVSGDGFSVLRDNEKILKNFGVAEYGYVKSRFNNWKEYSNTKLITKKMIENAFKHRTDSYWEISTIAEVYKAIDDGRTVKFGMRWCRAYNMSGGFKMPWIISKIIGMIVGGHAMFIKGYDTNYKGEKVFVVQNSFGSWWGDNGDFYITEKHLLSEIRRYGAFVNLDIKSDVGKFLMEMDGKNVKSKDSPAIFHIQRGKKKLYPDWVTFLAWNQLEKGYEIVDRNVIDKVPEGDNMDIKKTVYWDFIKHLDNPDNLTKILEILHNK